MSRVRVEIRLGACSPDHIRLFYVFWPTTETRIFTVAISGLLAQLRRFLAVAHAAVAVVMVCALADVIAVTGKSVLKRESVASGAAQGARGEFLPPVPPLQIRVVGGVLAAAFLAALAVAHGRLAGELATLGVLVRGEAGFALAVASFFSGLAVGAATALAAAKGVKASIFLWEFDRLAADVGSAGAVAAVVAGASLALAQPAFSAGAIAKSPTAGRALRLIALALAFAAGLWVLALFWLECQEAVAKSEPAPAARTLENR